jgi:hypothetical protein
MSLADGRPPLSTAKRRAATIAKITILTVGTAGTACASYMWPALAAPMLVGLTGLLVAVTWRGNRDTN